MSDSQIAPRSPRALPRLAWAFVGLGALVRILRLVFGTEVIEIEGVEYGRLAENLWRDGAYLGILRDSELMFPPLYPLILGMVSWLPGVDTELAARLVSLVAGTVFIALMGICARRFAGERAAVLATALAALWPGLVLASTSCFSEMTGATFLLGGFVAAWSLARGGGVAMACVSGFCLAAAYLTRVENLAVALFTIGLLAISAGRTVGLRRLAIVTATFVVLASPYPHYLWRTTGEVRVQAKSERVMATIGRFAKGQDFQTASYEIGPVGEPRGPWLTPNVPFDPPDASARGEASTSAFIGYWTSNLLAAGTLVIGMKAIGSPLHLLLAAVLLLAALRSGAWSPAALRRSDPEGKRFADLWLLGFAGLLVATGCFYKVILRYFVPLALPLGLWAVRGLVLTVDRRPGIARAIMIGGAVVLLLSSGARLGSGVREFGETDPVHAITREVGEQLAQDLDRVAPELPLTPGVMTHDPRFAWYSGAWWEPLPVTTDASLVVARARARSAPFIAIRRAADGSLGGRASDWFDASALPTGLELIRDDERVVVLRVR